LTQTQTLILFEEYLRGLATLHEAGYLHLDCHTGNLRIDNEGHGRLADFGSSWPIDSLNTKEGFCQIMPSSGYFPLPMAVALLAPEIVLGIGHFEELTSKISGKADVWALGCALGKWSNAPAYEHVAAVQKALQPNAEKFYPFKLKPAEQKTYYSLLNLNYPPEPLDQNSVDYLVWKMLHPDCNLRFSALEAADYISQCCQFSLQKNPQDS
jgi:serine/threonine protein kinase